jgi:very-long-chain ceramide synthase
MYRAGLGVVWKQAESSNKKIRLQMDATASPQWLSPYLVPFAYLSYPTEAPKNPDSFQGSSYYKTGIKDACFVIAWIAVLAILREFVRLAIMEPFARAWLSKQAARGGISTPKILQKSEKTTPAAKETMKDQSAEPKQKVEDEGLELLLRSRRNGNAKPKLEKITKRRMKGMTKEEWKRERSVLRFAEQGWTLVYYSVYRSLGIVRLLLLCLVLLSTPGSISISNYPAHLGVHRIFG